MANTTMLNSIRKRLDGASKGNFDFLGVKSKPSSNNAAILGAFALVWLADKLVVEKAHRDAQDFFDSAWDTRGANLHLLD